MTSQPIQYQDCEDALSQIQGELLEALLISEEDCYPWNPTESPAYTYFEELEAGFWLDYYPEEEEVASNSQALFNQLQECFSSVVLSSTDSLKSYLSERFASSCPQEWLDAIAQQAQQVFHSNLSLADRLVQCVKPLLPNWSEDDLLLLARPWAYAMRSMPNTPTQSLASLVQPVEWTRLSVVEQVRFSLAVAHSALVQLENYTSEN
jgi:hypothetical protein